MIMSFKDIAGSNILWTCVIIGIIIVTLLTVYYLRISYKNALELGIDKKTLKAVIKSSATFSIVPSIAIVAGLVDRKSVV